MCVLSSLVCVWRLNDPNAFMHTVLYRYGDGLTDYHVLGHDDKEACTRAALQARVHQGGEAPPRDTKL